MANPLKGEARLGECTLAFNFGAFCELEEKTGKKMPQLLEAINNGLGFSELRDFVWAGLQTNHKGATDADTAALLDEHGFQAGAEAVAKAVTAFFGSQKAKGKNPPKAA
jgi:hypothetical protein